MKKLSELIWRVFKTDDFKEKYLIENDLREWAIELAKEIRSKLCDKIRNGGTCFHYSCSRNLIKLELLKEMFELDITMEDLK